MEESPKVGKKHKGNGGHSQRNKRRLGDTLKVWETQKGNGGRIFTLYEAPPILGANPNCNGVDVHCKMGGRGEGQRGMADTFKRSNREKESL